MSTITCDDLDRFVKIIPTYTTLLIYAPVGKCLGKNCAIEIIKLKHLVNKTGSFY